MNSLKGFLHTAIRAAQAAAHLHRSSIGSDLGVAIKTSEADLVTRVDKESELVIREVLLTSYPDHVVLGEEEGQPGGDAPYRWIVDPLDGTLNYAHAFPFYCVSIALEIDGTVQVGVVLDSARGELFSATRGGGAYLNGTPIEVSRRRAVAQAMLATGFAYAEDSIAQNVAVFARMLSRCRAVRRPGAAALDLAYVAAGRLDGFWQLHLKPWDVAAGILLVEEAGGRVSSGNGAPYRFEDGALIASNALVHDELVSALGLSTADQAASL
jgi:myo-inositol-1(or 4)-monophosphatase